MTFQNPFRALTPDEQQNNPNTAPPPGTTSAGTTPATTAPGTTETGPQAAAAPAQAPAAAAPAPAADAPRAAGAAPRTEDAPAAAAPPAPAEAPSAALVPLPRDLALMPPAAGAPAELAPFWGIWRGDWDGGIPHVLVVESVDAAGARVVVAWGEAPAWNMQKGWERHTGAFADGALTVRTDRPGTITYRMRGPRTIEARYEWDGGSATATLLQ